MTFSTDIDIDFKDRAEACAVVDHVPASMKKEGLVRHPSGIYIQDIPVHPLLAISSLPYNEAEQYGYFKIDFLSNSVYEGVRDKAHLMDLMQREVPWELFQDRNVVFHLAHVYNHFGLLKHFKPESIDDLAIVLALMRPAKANLRYKDRDVIRKEIWKKDADEGYSFKKSHSVAYAVSIVVQLQLLIERIGNDIDNERVIDDIFSL